MRPLVSYVVAELLAGQFVLACPATLVKRLWPADVVKLKIAVLPNGLVIVRDPPEP
jgi:hypothetical protein